MIIQHRCGENAVKDENVDREDAKYLFNTAYECLFSDFRQPVLHGYFYKIRGIRELENYQQIKVKSREKVVLEGELSSKLRVVIIDDAWGGFFALVSALEPAGEPWEGQDPDDASVEIAYNRVYRVERISTQDSDHPLQ